MTDKLDFPATSRNSAAILTVLKEALPPGHILEIASGSGQHASAFAKTFSQNIFWPSDPDPAHVQSINAWAAETNLANLKPAQTIDATSASWLLDQPAITAPAQLAAILCINMVHIAPITATKGLLTGAARRLNSQGLLYLYGPFLGVEEVDAPSNLAFDADLKRRNAAWGVRDIDEIIKLANGAGFDHHRTVKMPANNFSVLFARR